MCCPKCGMENPDDAQTCRSCGTPMDKNSGDIVPRRSRLAIAAFVLGFLNPFTFGITFVPAVILSVLSIAIINRSGGRLTGTHFAELAIVIPVVLLVFGWVLVPGMLKSRRLNRRMTCGRNLVAIGKAMVIYANDYDGQFPRSAGKGGQWATNIQHWKGNNRYVAYGLAADGSGGIGTISSCFYLLVKYAEMAPKSFICPGDSGAREFKPAEYAGVDTELTDLWDFGPGPEKHCSYSYHQPFSLYPLTTSSKPGMAVAADRNPWMIAPASDGKRERFARFIPDGTRESVEIGNAIQHQERGQNVLFLDSHVAFERISFCGINDDNIYTWWDGSDIRRAGLPVLGASGPKDPLDSFLVHDGR